MNISLSEAASNAMLDALAVMLDGGSIELLSGDGLLLAVLKLSNPAASDAAAGELVLRSIGEEDAALAQGNAALARIRASDDSEILTCDVGDENSDAVVRLNTTSIFRGGPVRIRSFTLAMP